MPPRAHAFIGTLLCSASLAAAAALPSSWSIVELDGLPGEPRGVSDSGLIVGCSQANGVNRAFIWSNGTSRELPNLPPGSSSCAHAVNNAGMVAGVVDGQIVVWSEGAMMRLPVTGMPHAINDAGTVVGAITFSSDVAAPTHAFSWRQGVLTDLHPSAARSSVANAINQAGQVVGNVDNIGVLWQNGAMRTVAPEYGTADSINDFGQVVGKHTFDDFSKSRPYLFDGTLSALPGGGNELGVYVITNGGRVLVNGFDDYAAVIENGQRLSFQYGGVLNGTGWKRLEPRAMNNRGWVVGYGDHNGVSRMFLIVPQEGMVAMNPLARPAARSTPLLRYRTATKSSALAK
jgi:probable HAF family extracellular repeat protein